MPQDFAAELSRSGGVILFDGHCAFCRNVVGGLLRLCRAANLLVCSTRTERGGAFVRSMGRDPANTFAIVTLARTYEGVEAYARILALCPGTVWLARAIAAAPRRLSGGVYDWVAGHRHLMSSLFGWRAKTAIPPDRYVAGGDG